MTTDKKILAGLFLVLTFSAASAQTGLLLSGETIGIFRPIPVANSSAIQLSDKGNSFFRIGTPLEHSFQSGAQFNGRGFTQIGDGDTVSSDLLTYFNGLNRIGTSSGGAQLDLFLQLNGKTNLIRLTTINFGIDATVNSRGRPTPDIFRASFAQPEPLWVGDQWLKFTVTGLPDSFQLEENAKINLGSLTVAAIPEPPTGVILIGLVTLCFAIYLRQRNLSAA